MEAYWLPGVNALGEYGRWDFAEFTAVYDIDSGFNSLVAGITDQQESVASYEAAGWLSDAGGGERQVEDISRRGNEEYADFLVEQHRSQGERMMKFQEFERGLGESHRNLSQRERYLLFLEHESHVSEEGRERYIRVLGHERQHMEWHNPGSSTSSGPDPQPDPNDTD